MNRKYKPLDGVVPRPLNKVDPGVLGVQVNVIEI